MTAEERLNNFYKALIESSPVWFDGLPLVFPNKDIKDAVKKSWITLHAEGKLKGSIDWKECRNLVNKTLTWQEPKNSEGYEKAVPVQIHPQALIGEEREKRIAEFLKAHLSVTQEPVAMRINPYKEMTSHINDKEGMEYHPLPPKEIHRREVHMAWIKHCFDPKSTKPKPNKNWMPEDEFTKLYDEGLI